MVILFGAIKMKKKKNIRDLRGKKLRKEKRLYLIKSIFKNYLMMN